jgi:hypothetical protein
MSDSQPSKPPFSAEQIRNALRSSTQSRDGGHVAAQGNICPKCGGKGHIKSVGQDATGYPQVFMAPCTCVMVERFKHRVGPDIYTARSLKRSPLMSRTDKNLFLHAERDDLLPHLKFVLWHSGFDFFFRLLTDLDVIDAWLSKDKGNFSPNRDIATTSATLGMGVAWSSLRDAVEDPQLLVLYLGVSTHPNRALSNALAEAVKIRIFAGKPTWVINPTTRPWAEGYHPCYSEGLNDLLFQYCEQHILTNLTEAEAGSASKRAKQRSAQDVALSLGGNQPALAPPRRALEAEEVSYAEEEPPKPAPVVRKPFGDYF